MLKDKKKTSSRLVVVSYRGPVSLELSGGTTRFRRGEGGLVAALAPVMNARGGLWIASGERPAGVKEGRTFSLPGSDALEILHLSIPKSLHRRHYLGFSNRVLWPLAHGFPSLVRFDRAEFSGYRRVCELFAQAVAEHTRPGDLVWIHDYHFALLPQLVREEAPGRRIAHFWHIPFPPREVLRVAPFHEQLVTGMLGADVVHFHLPGYARAFREAAEPFLAPDGTTADGRRVRIGAHPIGIDTRAWEELAKDPSVARSAQILRRESGASRIVLGVDRLDYTKGILERILAFERLLEQEPRLRGFITLVQVAVPSRIQVPEYRKMRREIDETVGRVNGRFAQGAYTPVRYYYRTFPRRNLAALYRAADVGLVTPLRDGMNLVAMEFMFINADRAPLLILSELAGASEVLPGTLLVNPRDLDGVAGAMRRALEMPEDERESRAKEMVARIRSLDVHGWASAVLEALSGSGEGEGDRAARTEAAMRSTV